MGPENYIGLHQGLAVRQQLRLTQEMRLRLNLLHATIPEIIGILDDEMQENPLILDINAPREDLKVIENKPDKVREEDIPENDEFSKMDAEYGKNQYQRESYEDYKFDAEYKNRQDVQSRLMEKVDYSGMTREMAEAARAIIFHLDDNGILEDLIDTTPDYIVAESYSQTDGSVIAGYSMQEAKYRGTYNFSS